MAGLTVVVVSDYEASDEKTWEDEREALDALAAQDVAEDFRVILVENASARGSVPDDLAGRVPDLDVVFCDDERSAGMKDFGVGRASTELVAVMEADCLPDPGWLRVTAAALREHPEYAVVSGRTTYGDETSYRRCLSVLDRGFDDLGSAGETRHVSNNGALYRREVLARFPYPEAPTPFLSSRRRKEAMREAGHRFWFEPRAVTRHAIGGWGFMADFRRNTGFADAAQRGNPSLVDVPGLLWSRRVAEARHCARLAPRYLRWYDWPLLAALFLLAPALEVPGVLDAIRGRGRVPSSAYR